MKTRDSRVDAYIAAAAPFARPILRHLRKVVHAGCPGVEETIKWGFPHFVYKGNIAAMSAFQKHCSFGLWKGALIFGGERPGQDEAMGQFGRITQVGDLPDDKALIAYVRKAAQLNDAGVKAPRPAKPKTPRTLEIPDDFDAALNKNSRARKAFDGFSISKRREYVDWVAEAKREETRRQRLATSIEWLAQGKTRMWKYERK